jgi:drug/metabolite transporter (DMT)-like permease
MTDSRPGSRIRSTPEAGGPMPRTVYFYLGVIIASWAANWPLMKLALGEVRPLTFVLFRLVGSLVLIAPVLLWRAGPLAPMRGERLGLMWVGLLQVAGFLVCSIIGLAIVPPGRAIVLAYTMPLWAIPIERWLRPEPLGRFQLAGAALGFAGLILFMNPALVDWGNRRALAGNGLLLLAAISWALGSCLYRRSRWRSSFWVQTYWQLAVSIIVVAALALPEAANAPITWSPGLVAILAYNCVVTTALGYFLWSKVLTMMSAAVAGQVLALTPVGGFVLSTMLFGGAITIGIIVSIALIVAGIVLTLRA